MLQTPIPDALQALMVLAQQATPTTPDGAPTVAAQLAQMAAPQGVAQGMPQAVQDFEASAPSVMRNMQQEQLQRMMRQAMQPQPAGIEGLPAPNMNFAEGGVIGFAGPDGSEVDTKMLRMTPEEYERRRREAMLRGPAPERRRLLPEEEAIFAPLYRMPEAPLVPIPDVDMPVPERMRDTRAVPVAPARTEARPTETQRRPTPTPATAVQPPSAAILGGGIAQGLPSTPTLEQAMQQAERALPGSGTEGSRAALEELQRMRKSRPESGIATTKALEEEARTAAELKRKLDESARSRGIAAWLQGGARLGGSGRAVAAFNETENQRQMLYAQENTIRVSKMDAIKEANEARRIGDQEKYVEALNKLAELDRADKQVKAQLAAQTLGAGITARGQDITSGTATADREAAAARQERDIAARAKESAADRAIRERELAQRAEQLRLAAEQQGDVKLANAISAAQARVQQARNGLEKLNQSLGPNFQIYKLDRAKFAKSNPAEFKEIEDALRDYNEKVVKPADDQLNNLINQAASRSAGGQKVIDFSKI